MTERRFPRRSRIILLLILAGAAGFLAWDLIMYGRYVDAFSGATPRALHHPPPPGIRLLVDGRLSRPWIVTTRTLGLLASVRVRTREVDPVEGVMGAYAYTGVPVMHILAGVDPDPPRGQPDDRPLDMLVVFTARNGVRRAFAYGELVLADDALPVTLAWKREPILPERGAETYRGNRLVDELSGLRLVCPRETDTRRYLDDVVRMTLVFPELPLHRLPPVRKHFECRSETILCMDGDRETAAAFGDLPRSFRDDWFRIGHGRGIHSTRTARVEGVSLRDFLARHFPKRGQADFFLVSGCDGYRVLLSAREIFADPRGRRFMLVDRVDGQATRNGIMLGACGDFYIDRCVRGVSHLARLSVPLPDLELTGSVKRSMKERRAGSATSAGTTPQESQ